MTSSKFTTKFRYIGRPKICTKSPAPGGVPTGFPPEILYASVSWRPFVGGGFPFNMQASFPIYRRGISNFWEGSTREPKALMFFSGLWNEINQYWDFSVNVFVTGFGHQAIGQRWFYRSLPDPFATPEIYYVIGRSIGMYVDYQVLS